MQFTGCTDHPGFDHLGSPGGGDHGHFYPIYTFLLHGTGELVPTQGHSRSPKAHQDKRKSTAEAQTCLLGGAGDLCFSPGALNQASLTCISELFTQFYCGSIFESWSLLLVPQTVSAPSSCACTLHGNSRMLLHDCRNTSYLCLVPATQGPS